MADVTFFILGVLILVGFTGSLLFSLTKIPEVLFLIIAGILLGPVFGVVETSTIMSFGAVITTLMLITVMLDNGLSFDIFNVVKGLPVTFLFTVLVIGTTTAALTFTLHAMLSLSYISSAVIALAMAGTTTDVVTVLLSRMKISKSAKQLLVFESVLNDIQLIPFFILIHFLETSTISQISAIKSLFLLMPLSILIGSLAALWWVHILGTYLGKHPLNYVATVGILFIVYNIAQILGGHGAIAILTFSLIFGNALELIKKFRMKVAFAKKFTLATIATFKQIEVDMSFFVKTFFFVFLGLIFRFETWTKSMVITSVVILAVIILCRYVIVKGLSFAYPHYRKHTGPMTWIMPRGYIAAVLAFSAAGTGLFSQHIVQLVLLNIFLTTLVSIGYSAYHARKK